VLERLRAAWHEARRALGLGDDDAAFDDLVRRYAEPHRRYHDLAHVDACLRVLAAHRSDAHRIGEVAMALLFHDAIYDPKAADNEDRSARLACDTLERGGAAPRVVARIEAMIRATARHETQESGDAALVLDADLSILGEDEETYAAFERAIRAEYPFVDEASFRAARRAVLARFLARPVIYSTPSIRAEREARARTNLTRAIAELDRRAPPGIIAPGRGTP